MSNGTITFSTNCGKFDLDVTTFQMAVLFAWNQRQNDKITYENLRLATELPDGELRRTLWSLIAFPKLKRQLLLFSPEVNAPKDFTEHTVFWVNQEFILVKNGKQQKRGKVMNYLLGNLITIIIQMLEKILIKHLNHGSCTRYFRTKFLLTLYNSINSLRTKIHSLINKKRITIY